MRTIYAGDGSGPTEGTTITSRTRLWRTDRRGHRVGQLQDQRREASIARPEATRDELDVPGWRQAASAAYWRSYAPMSTHGGPTPTLLALPSSTRGWPSMSTVGATGPFAASMHGEPFAK
jgi:hypothetical protein